MLTLQYNAVSDGYRSVNITKTNTNAWRSVDLHLTDAAFAGTQSYGGDFRISNHGDGSAEWISKVSVSVP